MVGYLKNIELFFKIFFVFLIKKLIAKPHSIKINLISIKKKSGLESVLKRIKLEINKKYPSSIIKEIYLDNQKLLKKKFQSDINIWIGNPDIVNLAIKKYSNQINLNKYNIGSWFWELDKLPIKWRITNLIIDEIWVFSDFNKYIFLKYFKNIKKINLPLKKIKPLKQIESKKIKYLISFDYDSYFERKNPLAGIKSFKEAFKKDEDVQLIIKTRNHTKHKYFHNKLIKNINNDSRIKLIPKEMNQLNYETLLNSIHCYISLHRSEGLGLGIMEAIENNKKIVATSYSGNVDFINYKNVIPISYKLIDVKMGEYPYFKNCKWAEPNIDEASKALKKVYYSLKKNI